MSQKFTGTVIKLRNLKTATVELTFNKLHPKYHKPQKIKKFKQVHYEVSKAEINNWLIKYFEENQVKKISLEDSKLVIVYNNNKTAPLKQVIEKYELQNIKYYLAKINQNFLTIESLKSLNSPNLPKKEFLLQLGDKVKIKSDRPRSKTKRFLVIGKENS